MYTIAKSPQAPPKAYKSGRELLRATPLFRLLKEGKNSICARLAASGNIAPGKVWTNCRGGGLCLARALPALSSAPCRASVTLSKYITAPALGDAIRGRASPVYRFPHFPAAAAPLAVRFTAMSAPYRRGQGAMISALANKRRGGSFGGTLLADCARRVCAVFKVHRTPAPARPFPGKGQGLSSSVLSHRISHRDIPLWDIPLQYTIMGYPNASNNLETFRQVFNNLSCARRSAPASARPGMVFYYLA